MPNPTTSPTTLWTIIPIMIIRSLAILAPYWTIVLMASYPAADWTYQMAFIGVVIGSFAVFTEFLRRRVVVIVSGFIADCFGFRIASSL